MTDLDKVKALHDELGIGYEEQVNPEKMETYIVLKEGREKIVGHPEFYTHYKFDFAGAFIEVGIYE
jgi:hypothetical protein